ncbi:hybrid sensor histidine kinase/response regulator [Hyphococcus flavus]|uniref:histidine kinase n=1 Tax=Hyphococcus flavus TaxID=1866326 RepID=A0AAE9ZCT5_9PROT|nr:hybrid sensor histidine kinase/response regulator [Hyphococcus flavus]WDI31145.1 hybrid sensor histidine kinase/response regulator [Hyphococcus flavus]
MMTSQPDKILLVDDEPKLISALRRRLSGEFSIVTANSGAEALQVIDNDPHIAVIVADMQMPGMNGIELLKHVKEKAPSIRRLMLTGNSDQETAVAAVNEGRVMRFMRKPCDHETLKSALREALDEFAFQHADTIPSNSPAPSDGAEDARNAFLSMMSHELKTPLNHIIGFAKVLQEQKDIGEDNGSLEFLTHIRDSGEEMLTLVNRILEFSRLRSEAQSSNDESVDIVDVVNSEIQNIRKEARAKAITISVDSLRLKADVVSNPDEARTAIRELLSNAVKFNKDEGHISVLIKCDRDQTAVRISDSGGGAPAAVVEQLAAPFQQANNGYDRGKEGVGLGLALVSTIAQSNNISFRFETGAGGAVATLVFQRPSVETLVEHSAA